MALNLDDYCIHEQPRFLCRLGCNENNPSRPVVASSGAGQAIPKGDERVKVADQAIFATLAAAEEVHQPLYGSVEETAGDHGAPFVSEGMAALAAPLPPSDPWAPGVRAIDVPVTEAGDSNPLDTTADVAPGANEVDPNPQENRGSKTTPPRCTRTTQTSPGTCFSCSRRRS